MESLCLVLPKVAKRCVYKKRSNTIPVFEVCVLHSFILFTDTASMHWILL